MKVLITGHSSGLGAALTDKFAEKGHEVYGISRTSTKKIREFIVDFESDIHDNKLSNFISSLPKIDLFFMNAGTLGPLRKATDISVEELAKDIKVNVLSHKIILDKMIKNNMVSTVVAISSGAAIKPKFGWLNYCCSKSMLKMMIENYAEENHKIKFYSLAPGLIKTSMQDKIINTDPNIIPSVRRFQQEYDTMKSPTIVANNIYNCLEQVNARPSGAFIDIRKDIENVGLR